MLRRAWRNELDSHILDCADELVKLGYDRQAALTEAKQQFGDAAKIQKELEQVHPWLAVYADWIALGLLGLSIIPLYALHYLAASTLLGLVSDNLLLWWYGGALMIISLLLLKWQLNIIPLTKRTSIAVAISIGWFVASCITIALDPNNFETILYNGLFGLSSLALLIALWKPLGLLQRQIWVMVTVSLMVVFAWREEGLWESELFRSCLYLVDNNPYASPSSQCVQVSWFSSYAWLLYAMATLSISYLTYYTVQLWRLGTHLSRKLITTAAWVVLPLSAVSISGINSTGALDVVAWKTDIYQTYVDILGRRPEEKDYQFYGNTRSYEHMSEVRSVLYDSPERKEKIKLLYEDTLLREPTAEELDTYFKSPLTIQAIQQELEQSKN